MKVSRQASRVLAAALGLVVLAARARATDAKEAAARTMVDVVPTAEVVRALKQQKGHVVLLHFWASWCLPCIEELPLVATFAREMKAKGVDVISFSLDTASTQSAQKVARVFAERTANAFETRIVEIDDPDVFINAIDPKWEGTIPALFVYDRNGALKGSLIGESSRPQLDRLVGALLSGPARTR